LAMKGEIVINNNIRPPLPPQDWKITSDNKNISKLELISSTSSNIQESNPLNIQNKKVDKTVSSQFNEASTSNKISQSTVTNEDPQSSQSTNEKPKETPTEYVHELEFSELASFTWDDSG
jgi:hypothetical protein